MDRTYKLHFAGLITRCPDVEPNPGPRSDALRGCRILYSNVRGLCGNIRDLSVASSTCDVLLCCETLVSDRRRLSQLQIPKFGYACPEVSCCVPVVQRTDWWLTSVMVLWFRDRIVLNVLVARCSL